MENRWPRHRVDVRSTVREWIIATHRANALPAISTEWNENRIFRAVQTIFSEQLALPRERITPDTHLLHDLKLDQ